MTVTYQRETLRSVLDSGNLERLLIEHWAEIAHFKDIPLDVRWPVYEAAEAAGKIRIFTARDDEHLVGYIAYTVDMNPHYQSSRQAIQDVLFLTPRYRKALIGLRLVDYSERRLAEEGVQAIYQHSKVAHPMDGLLERLGYERVETIWAKRLDRS